MSIEEFANLVSTGFQGGGGKEEVAPEDEIFHSLYIPVTERTNHINIVEKPDILQIRGVDYNLNEVNIIITHTKDVLANITRDRQTQKDVRNCFSFKEGSAPWYGTSKMPDGSARQCPQTSADRAVNTFCSPCRAQIIVAGLYCNPDGSPILTEEKKPYLVFFRGKGMKYSNVSEYLNSLYREDTLTPLFSPTTPQSLEFEKAVVNNKRFVTKITFKKEKTSYNSLANVFVLTRGPQISNKDVMDILKLSKNTIDKFNEKFDWSKGNQATNSYVPPGVLSTAPKTDAPKTEEPKTEKVFSFDDIKY